MEILSVLTLLISIALIVFLARKYPRWRIHTVALYLLRAIVILQLIQYFIHPYNLESIEDWGNNKLGTTVVLHPYIILLFVIGLLPAIIVLFGFKDSFRDKERIKQFIIQALIPTLAFIYMEWYLLDFRDRLEPDERLEIFEELGGRG